MIIVDQIDSLIDTSSSTIRRDNYHDLRTIWNKIANGYAPYTMLCLFGADRIMTDKKGVSQYDALYQVMQSSITIDRVDDNSLVAICARLKELHEQVYKWESNVTDETVEEFVRRILPNLPMNGNCIRPITIPWIRYLDDLMSGGKVDMEQFLGMGQSISKYDEGHKDGSLPAEMTEDAPQIKPL